MPVENDGYQVLVSDKERVIARVSTDYPRKLSHLAVPRELEVLLDSARIYVPAMARLRDSFSHDEDVGSDEAFIRRAQDFLSTEFANQPNDRAVLVRSRIDEGPYRLKGEYVWALGLSKDGKKLNWAGGDADSYFDSVESFDISQDLIQRLSRPHPSAG